MQSLNLSPTSVTLNGEPWFLESMETDMATGTCTIKLVQRFAPAFKFQNLQFGTGINILSSVPDVHEDVILPDE